MLSISLLGRPRIVAAGRQPHSPRGGKAWALLAYVVLAERPPSRHELAALLFSDAQDPLGALRWNLSELRRSLGEASALSGDPLSLGVDAEIDVRALESTNLEAEDVLRLGAEFLEGVDVAASAAFESWVGATRQRLRASTCALLHETALYALATGHPEHAGAVSARALALDPFDAKSHALLVRSLSESGDAEAARRQVERSTQLFHDDLGIDLPDAIRRAASPPISRSPVRTPSTRASASSYLNAGKAAFSVGAVEVGTERLRRAVDLARSSEDAALEATALVTLAGCQIHGAGRRGTEVAGPLLRALATARSSGDTRTASQACRELAFLGVQLGHHHRAEGWLHEALSLDLEPGERAKALGVLGMSRSDTAHYDAALLALEASVSDAESARMPRQVAWSQAMIARVHLQRGRPAEAAAILDESLETLARERWTAVLPWVQYLRVEASIEFGDLEAAVTLLDHAWALASELGDHCWLATVARGQARAVATRGDRDGAIEWIRAGLEPSPWYLWPVANLLDTGCVVVEGAGPGAGGGVDAQLLLEEWSSSLQRMATRAGQREHLVRALLHRRRCGGGGRDPLEAARLLAAEIDNPALACLVAGAGE